MMYRVVGAVAVLMCGLVSGVISAEAQEGDPGDTITVNAITLGYRTAGDGAPLLLLHYYGGCGAVWEPFIEQLSASYRLIIPDLRGHGRSTSGAGAFTHREAARDIHALLDSLRIERVRAIGLSSGGMTLLHMATQQPSRIESMILVGATSHFPDEARRIMAGSHPDSLSSAALERWGRCSARGEKQTRDILMQFHGMKDSYDDMNFTAPYLSTVTARTMIVHGDRDEYFPVDIAVAMYESIPESVLWVIPNAGHMPIFGSRTSLFLDHAMKFFDGG